MSRGRERGISRRPSSARTCSRLAAVACRTMLRSRARSGEGLPELRKPAASREPAERTRLFVMTELGSERGSVAVAAATVWKRSGPRNSFCCRSIAAQPGRRCLQVAGCTGEGRRGEVRHPDVKAWNVNLDEFLYFPELECMTMPDPIGRPGLLEVSRCYDRPYPATPARPSRRIWERARCECTSQPAGVAKHKDDSYSNTLACFPGGASKLTAKLALRGPDASGGASAKTGQLPEPLEFHGQNGV